MPCSPFFESMFLEAEGSTPPRHLEHEIGCRCPNTEADSFDEGKESARRPLAALPSRAPVQHSRATTLHRCRPTVTARNAFSASNYHSPDFTLAPPSSFSPYIPLHPIPLSPPPPPASSQGCPVPGADGTVLSGARGSGSESGGSAGDFAGDA